jgi:hypothetical protein
MANIWGNLATQFGSGLGSGISQGLEELAHKKTKELQRKNHIKDYVEAGFTPEESAFIISVPDENKWDAIRYLSDNKNRYQQQMTYEPRSYQDYLDMERGAYQSEPSQELQESYNPLNDLVSMQQEVIETPDNVHEIERFKDRTKVTSSKSKNNKMVTPVEEELTEELSIKKAPSSKTIDKIKKTLPQSAQKISEKDQIAISKSAREWANNYLEKASASRANIRDYDLLIKQAQSGKLRAGTKQQLLSKVGLSEFNQPYQNELANKLIARLAQNVGSAFGTGRLTNFLEATFQKSLPSLWNTPEGIITISRLNKAADEANILKAQAAREILQENGGRIPPDADFQIEERTLEAIQDIEVKLFEELGLITQEQFAVGMELAELPNPSQVPPSTVIEDDEGNEYKIVEGQWVRA